MYDGFGKYEIKGTYNPLRLVILIKGAAKITITQQRLEEIAAQRKTLAVKELLR